MFRKTVSFACLKQFLCFVACFRQDLLKLGVSGTFCFFCLSQALLNFCRFSLLVSESFWFLCFLQVIFCFSQVISVFFACFWTVFAAFGCFKHFLGPFDGSKQYCFLFLHVVFRLFELRRKAEAYCYLRQRN